MKRLFQACLAAFLTGTVTTPYAQDLSSVYAGMQNLSTANVNFDAQVNAQLNAMQQQLNAQQVQFWQSVLQNPEMQAAYQQYRAQGGQYPYEQFAYWYVMTAGGTNVQGGVDAQRRQFEGWQQANRTVQEGYASYNEGWRQNQARLDATQRRYDDGAVRGNWYYQNPDTGENYTLPYTSGPGYYTSGSNTFYMDANGQYYMYSGNNWTRMNMVNR